MTDGRPKSIGQAHRIILQQKARIERLQAKLYRKDERINAWANAAVEMEAEVERLRAKLAAYDNPGQTHSEECWRWHGHSECAVREIERLQSDRTKLLDVNEALTADTIRLRAALESIAYEASPERTPRRHMIAYEIAREALKSDG